MVHAFNPRSWEAKADRCLRARGCPGLHNEFQNCQSCIVRPHQKKEKQRANQRVSGCQATVFCAPGSRDYLVGCREEIAQWFCLTAVEEGGTICGINKECMEWF